MTTPRQLPAGTRFLSCVSRMRCTLLQPAHPHRDYWVGHAAFDGGDLYYAIVRPELVDWASVPEERR